MKYQFAKSLAIILSLSVCYSVSFAQNPDPMFSKNYAKAELNFMKGLESDINGVRTNAAYFLGEIKSQASVSYLTHLMKYDKYFPCRIVAALSLLKIGNPAGIQEVKMIRDFIPPDTSSDKSHMIYLSILWNQYLVSHPEDELVLKNIQFPSEG